MLKRNIWFSIFIEARQPYRRGRIMEPNEEAIKMLETRMRSQMGRPSEKSINPENLQYFLPHVTRQKEDIWQDIRGEEKETDDWMTGGNGFGAQAAAAVTSGQTYIKEPAGPAADAAEEVRVDYENLLADVKYIEKVGRMAHMMGQKEAPEANEVQHARARSGYEKVSREQDGTGLSRISRRHLVDMKG